MYSADAVAKTPFCDQTQLVIFPDDEGPDGGGRGLINILTNGSLALL